MEITENLLELNIGNQILIIQVRLVQVEWIMDCPGHRDKKINPSGQANVRRVYEVTRKVKFTSPVFCNEGDEADRHRVFSFCFPRIR